MGVEGGGGAEKEIIELLPHLKLWISGDERRRWDAHTSSGCRIAKRC